MVDLAVQLLTDICENALPIGIVFAFAELIISTFMRVAFGGRLWFGR